MGTKYPTQAATGYNATPPADDGTSVEANRITWAKHKTKLADPVKNLADAMNTALLAALDHSVVDTAVNLTTTAIHHVRTVNVTAAITVSLGDAATMAVGYVVSVKNSHSAAITIDLATGADTLNGSAGGSISLSPEQILLFTVTTGADGYIHNVNQTNAEIQAAIKNVSGGIYFGRVNSAGTVVSGNSGFTVSKTGSGTYRLEHGLTTIAFSFVITTTDDSAGLPTYAHRREFSRTAGADTDNLDIEMYTGGTSTSVEAAWAFILILD